MFANVIGKIRPNRNIEWVTRNAKAKTVERQIRINNFKQPQISIQNKLHWPAN